MTQRYKLHQQPDGMWAVFDTQNNRPAEMGSRTIVGMNRQDAQELVDLLNRLNAQREKTEP